MLMCANYSWRFVSLYACVNEKILHSVAAYAVTYTYVTESDNTAIC